MTSLRTESFMPLTNEAREAYKKRQRSTRVFQQTPLMLLGAWVREHGNDVLDAPTELLEKTMLHVELRLKTLRALKTSSRIRAQMKWLTRWRTIIKLENARQVGAV